MKCLAYGSNAQGSLSALMIQTFGQLQISNICNPSVICVSMIIKLRSAAM